VINVVKEDAGMSRSHKSESWLDRWWLLLLILFGLVFISVLAFFHPSY